MVRPGIMHVEYEINGEIKIEEYATGGGVISINPERVTVVSEAMTSENELSDIEYIEAQKKEAKEMMDSYRAKHKEEMNTKHLIDLEYEFLKFTAMHELARRIKHADGRRF